MKIEVFDPPMCCSSGVCGPSVDSELVRFAADLDWLKRQGVDVQRNNLSQQPAAFAGNDVVKAALAKDGNDCLPLILLDGTVVSKKASTRLARRYLATLGSQRARRRTKHPQSRSPARAPAAEEGVNP